MGSGLAKKHPGQKSQGNLLLSSGRKYLIGTIIFMSFL